MRKTSTLLLVLCILCSYAFSQTRQWIWEGGGIVPNQPGVYGAQYVPSPLNQPGARQNGKTWTGTDGSLFLFGGYGYDEAAKLGHLTDLWKLDPKTLLWTWLTGSKEAVEISGPSLYGVKGMASIFNRPGERLSPVTWYDQQNNLWLYGGRTMDGTGWLNDLWKFDVTTRMWTWVSGDNTPSRLFFPYHAPVYGTKGIPAADNKPGARAGALGWTDKEGNLWMFGGIGWSPGGGFGDLNDLWKYNPTTNMWTWMHGSEWTYRSSSVGERGIAGVNNTPGSRYGSVGVTDESGNLWLMGGTGASSQLFQKPLDDLWKYNPATNMWMLVSGDIMYSTNTDPVYGTKGIADAANKPGTVTTGTSGLESDGTGNLWLFGPSLWKFNIATGLWTWVETLGASGIYETKGIASENNLPGSRNNAMIWADGGDNILFMGGTGRSIEGSAGYLNDLWNYAMIKEEVCNDKDDDRDGVVDEGFTKNKYYQDNDKDGYGSEVFIMSCISEPPAGYATSNGDCVDNDPMIHPNTSTANGTDWIYSVHMKPGAYNAKGTGCSDDIGMITTLIGGGNVSHIGTSYAFNVSQGATIKLKGDVFAFNANSNIACAAPREFSCATSVQVFLIDATQTAQARPASQYIFGQSELTTIKANSTSVIPITITKSLIAGKQYRLRIEGRTGACNNNMRQVYVVDNLEVLGTTGGEICGNGIDDNCNGQVDENCATSINYKMPNGSGAGETSATKGTSNKESLQIKVLPNPSSTQFMLDIKSTSDKPVSVRVMDGLGKVLETRLNISSKGYTTFGSNYRPGIYYVEIVQGNERQTLKLIKQAH